MVGQPVWLFVSSQIRDDRCPLLAVIQSQKTQLVARHQLIGMRQKTIEQRPGSAWVTFGGVFESFGLSEFRVGCHSAIQQPVEARSAQPGIALVHRMTALAALECAFTATVNRLGRT